MYIYRTPFFNKQLQALSKSDKKGSQAAERADEIISQLAASGWDGRGQRRRYTRHGELRVRKCLKFDLGSGYRLISLKGDGELFLMYVGTHDECNRWLNNKRGCKMQLEPQSFVLVVVNKENNAARPAEFCSAEESDEYEEQLSTKLSDTLLRQIFPGICCQR